MTLTVTRLAELDEGLSDDEIEAWCAEFSRQAEAKYLELTGGAA